ncbi:MAG TPA: hypothetical protein EYP53_05120 [Candidatus Latescibacteria bacterium]|nr:hypothetical protein [Candidatus Latescibacterota bacterium]
MDVVTASYLAELELGELMKFEAIGIYPLFSTGNGSLRYLTLKEALNKDLLIVTEVDQAGSVPELKVVNKGERPVLLLDGEELIGAKQNRILNTTVLLGKRSETIIPVSCTERGRWSWTSGVFADSDAVASPGIRAVKAASVAGSLDSSRTFRSDQSMVWEGVDELAKEAKVYSPTAAMRDVFEARRDKLEDCLKAFEYIPGQCGLLAFSNEEVVGCDVIPYKSAYRQLHEKLVKSYALDVLLRKNKSDHGTSREAAETFLKKACSCGEKRYKSVGLGWDCRFEGEEIVGSALLYRKKVIHATFFKVDKSGRTGYMASSRRRMGFRVR